MYEERPSRLTGAVVWRNTPAESGVGRVLPDGCMDLLWHEGRLLVAGPDTRAYVTEGATGVWTGVRLPPGTAPALRPQDAGPRAAAATGTGAGPARQGLPFAETAALAGFADQAHLSRDVR